MKSLPLSSGDLVADRRADYAEMLRGSGDVAAAADLMRDAVALAPGWVAGWYRLGELLDETGRPAEAVEAWREALRLDPADRLGASLKLELAGVLAVSEMPPSGFVETLFDQYAGEFDTALVEQLGYRVPKLIEEAIVVSGITSFARAVDLGCGTGLMGERLRHIVSFLEGIDISAGMLARARAKGVYDRLEQGDLQMLVPGTDRVDLVTAADVLIYLGRLERVFGTVAAMLAPGGLFAFSVESHAGPEDLILRDSRRYAHSRRYVAEQLDAGGFDVVSMEQAHLRSDRGAPISGLVVLAARRGPAASAMVIAGETGDEALTPAVH
jgi:predicted TPR repeat methyltransferase